MRNGVTAVDPRDRALAALIFVGCWLRHGRFWACGAQAGPCAARHAEPLVLRAGFARARRHQYRHRSPLPRDGPERPRNEAAADAVWPYNGGWLAQVLFVAWGTHNAFK